MSYRPRRAIVRMGRMIVHTYSVLQSRRRLGVIAAVSLCTGCTPNQIVAIMDAEHMVCDSPDIDMYVDKLVFIIDNMTDSDDLKHDLLSQDPEY